MVSEQSEKPRRRANGGRVVLTPGSEQPFKAIVTFEDGHISEHPFASLQEGEAFLRARCPGSSH